MLPRSSISYIAGSGNCSLYVFIIVLTAAISCVQPVSNAEQARFDIVLVKIDSSITGKTFTYTEADMALLDASFSLIQNPGAGNIANKNYRKISYYAATKSDYTTALLYADSNISLLQNGIMNDQLADLYIRTLFVKGDICYRVKNYDEAISNYSLGKAQLDLQLASGKKDSGMLFLYHRCMANILYAQQNYLKAANFYRMKCADASSWKNLPLASYMEIQENLDNVGICYSKAGLTDSALHYFYTTLDYISQNEKKFPSANPADFKLQKSVVRSNLAEALYQRKEMEAAKSLFLQTIEYFKKIKEFAFARSLQLSLASLYIETSEIQKAGRVLLDKDSLVAAGEISNEACTYYKLLSGYYSRTNNPFAANSALLHAYNIKDSLEKQEWQFNSIDVRREFENQEQNAINQELRKDNEIKTGYLIMAFTSAALGVIVIFLIRYSLKRKSSFVKKLSLLNSEISRKNEDIQTTFTSLEQSHRENNRMMRVMAHELKNPISAMRMLVYSLLKNEPAAEKIESLELVKATCTDSIALIDDLLNNKRSLKDISKELVDMGRLIEQCTELFQVKAEEKNQRITLQTDHPVMMLNRQKIWRVISNIVNNAIKFSPPNAEIAVKLQRKEDRVLLSVQDNGIGIPAELKEKIFTVDPQVSRMGTAGEESYGLGLSISRKIIEEHDGQLWFESETGKGSVFYVELPFSEN